MNTYENPPGSFWYNHAQKPKAGHSSKCSNQTLQGIIHYEVKTLILSHPVLQYYVGCIIYQKICMHDWHAPYVVNSRLAVQWRHPFVLYIQYVHPTPLCPSLFTVVLITFAPTICCGGRRSGAVSQASSNGWVSTGEVLAPKLKWKPTLYPVLASLKRVSPYLYPVLL